MRSTTEKSTNVMDDPDTMVGPLTPKSTRQVVGLDRVSPTIVSCREEDAALRKWSLSRYCYASSILETKTKTGSTTENPGPTYQPKYR